MGFAKFSWAALGASLSLVLAYPELQAAHSSGSALATENPLATQEAARILQRGGNAADAAITAALVAGVASPSSSGIGGGGFLVAYDAERATVFALDFREVAPRGLKREQLEERPVKQAGALVGVPGELRGLWELSRRMGKLSFRDLVLPAAKQARDGFIVHQHLAKMLGYGEAKLKGVPGLGIFYPGGKPAVVGARVQNQALARTLALVAEQGVDAFYEGEVAEAFVEHARAHGSQLQLQDLRDYKVAEREPLRVEFNGAEVFTMPPPSAGGLMVAEILQLFSPDELLEAGENSPELVHLVAEGMRGAISDRMRYLADPDHTELDVEALLQSERLLRRRSQIASHRTHALPRFTLDEHGTHHLSVADSSGNLIALTTTVNRLFGSKLYVEDWGIVQNDELADFNSKSDVAAFGLEDTPNAPRPLARPVSSMTPTIVLREGRPELALGGSGGTAIATNTTQVLLRALLFESSEEELVSAPRFYIPFDERTLLLDPGFDQAAQRSLQERGELIGPMPFQTTGVQLVRLNDKGVRAAADPRKHGQAWTSTP